MSRVSVYSFPPTPQDWIRIQDVVRAYYVNQKLPLRDVRIALRDRHGFRATDRMIKARLKQWGYLKNAKKEDWHFLALLHERRKQNGKSATVFDVRGHRKTVKDLHRFIRNQNMTNEQFLDEARRNTGNKQMPDYIRASTPDDSQYHESPQDDIDVDYETPSPPSRNAQVTYPPDPPQSQFLRPQRPTNHQRMRSMSGSSSDYLTVASSTISQPYSESTNVRDSAYMSTPSSSNDSHCTQIQTEFEMLASQITRPAPLPSRIGGEDISSWALISSSPSGSDTSGRSVSFVCSRCNQPNEQHFISLDSFEPQQVTRRDILHGYNQALHLPVSTKDEGSWLWVSRCFLACICLKKGASEAAEQSLREAAREFERLLEKKDRQLLTAAGLVITLLHMHDQGEISQKVMNSAYEVTKKTLTDDDPIAVTIRYLTASAAIKQREWSITPELMYDVYRNFLNYYPAHHEYVIAARHNYAWMLKYDGKLEAAELEAREVYAVSCQVFGEIHMQSITALAVIAGCMYTDQTRNEECISIFERVVKTAGSTLGHHHPYTLEAKRRMADKMVELGGSNRRTLRLYQDVLWGRVHMLGPAHSYTTGARERYEQELQALNLWVGVSGHPSVAQQEVIELFSPNSPGAWMKISRWRTSSQHTRPIKGEMTANDLPMDEDDEIVMEDVKADGSQSPRSNHDFEAF